MSKAAHSLAEENYPAGRDLVVAGTDGHEDAARLERARPIPRISIQAFCEDGATAEVVQIAAADRRLSKSHISVHMGGAIAAVAHYHDSPTPISSSSKPACRVRRCWPNSIAWRTAATPALKWW
ncbi:MAG: hypothetical protein WAO08_29595 [Hyphomicrobiaceae bacterium]